MSVLALGMLSWLVAVPPPPTSNDAPVPTQESLRQARAAYDYGNYGAAAIELDRLTQARSLERATDQIEAFRLLGLARFFLQQLDEAQRAFLNLLSLDPDFQMDPLYVPPQAIAAFEQVRRKNQTLLEPIRQRRRATQEALAQEEAARQRFLAQAPKLESPTLVRERVERPSVALALLPFGIGQFQNGNRPLGITLAALEALALGSSVGCYLWVESKRGADGYFSATDYSHAAAIEDVQIGAGIGFGALWILGAVEALLRLRPPTVVQEETVPTNQSSGPKVGIQVGPTAGGLAGALKLSF